MPNGLPDGGPDGMPNGNPNEGPNGMPNGDPNPGPNGMPNGGLNGHHDGGPNDQANEQASDQANGHVNGHVNGDSTNQDEWSDEPQCGCTHDGHNNSSCSHNQHSYLPYAEGESINCCYCTEDNASRACEDCDCIFHESCLRNNSR